jgi:hypothetical protein
MGMTFEEYKRRKLKRMLGLRIMNALGMVAWQEGAYNDAEQRLRLLHPLSWPWITILTLYSIFAQGVPNTLKDLKSTLKNETVWF